MKSKISTLQSSIKYLIYGLVGDGHDLIEDSVDAGVANHSVLDASDLPLAFLSPGVLLRLRRGWLLMLSKALAHSESLWKMHHAVGIVHQVFNSGVEKRGLTDS